MKTEIFGMPLPQLQTALAELGLKKFRAKQIFDWLYQKCVFDFAQMSNLGKAERQLLQDCFSVLPAEIKIVRKMGSSDGLTRKAYWNCLTGMPSKPY